MSDISVKLSFDYSPDTNFSPPPFPYVPNGVNVLDINNVDAMQDYFKQCGWFSIWGKEIEGIDASKPGGSAFIGSDDSWLYMRKSVEWLPVGQIVPQPIVKSIEAKANLKKGSGANSPIVISMNLDGASFAFLLHKIGSGTNVMGLLGSNLFQSELGLKNARIPFPANATWITHPQYQKGRKVSSLAMAFNTVNVKIDIQTNQNLVIGWMAMQNPSGGSIVGPPSGGAVHNSMPIDEMRRSYPNTAIAKLVEWGVANNFIMFDPPMVSTRNYKKRYSQQQPNLFDSDNIESSTLSAALDTFVPPQELELPDLSRDVKWKLNIRGVVILEKDGQLLWPHEVFDLHQMVQDSESMGRQIAVSSNEYQKSEIEGYKDNLDKQIAKVRALFEYQAQVGESISLQSRIFGEV